MLPGASPSAAVTHKTFKRTNIKPMLLLSCIITDSEKKSNKNAFLFENFHEYDILCIMRKRICKKIIFLTLSILLLFTAICMPARAAAAGSLPAEVSCETAADGFITVQIREDADRFRVEVQSPDGSRASYPLGNASAENDGSYTIPLTGGSGSYRIDLLEQVPGSSRFAYLSSERLDAETADETAPFLRGNCVVFYEDGDPVTETARNITEGMTSQSAMTQAVYDYVISHVAYDTELAANAPVDYVPSPNSTLEAGTGVAPDYAALLAAMLRSVGIPARMETGYLGEMYHAWVSVRTDASGTVGGAFDVAAGTWSVIDPTLGACNKPDQIRAYLSKKSRYTPLCSY